MSTHAHLDDASPGRQIHPGQYIVVGDEDVDPAVAHIVDVNPDGVTLLRVLPGHADAHRELLGNQPA